jgi:hypothetical protein
MTAGRPTKYKPEYCDLAETILSEDMPWCQVASILNVCEDTLDAWKREHPKFLDAHNRGRAKGRAIFLAKTKAAAWDADTHHVNNGLISLLAINMYDLTTAKSEGKNDVNVKGSLSLADAVRLRHETDVK